MDLSRIGWSDHWQALLPAPLAADRLPARVVTEEKHYYTVVSPEGPHLAQVVGRLFKHNRSHADMPKVGDWVIIHRPPATDRVSIESVLPRRSLLARKLPGRAGERQILATNVDTVFIVQALDETLNLRRIERFLVMVHEGGAQPVVVLNKADLCENVEDRLTEVRAVAGQHPVLAVSARTGRALPQLRAFLGAGCTVVFAGTSGVGKSSLVNRLYGDRIQPTLPIREWDSKGRHTTSVRELILLPDGGLVIDTPGIREFHLWLADDGLDDAFADIAALAAGCQFGNCRHRSEGGCAVRQAAAEGRLAPQRLDSFLKLQAELESVAARRQEKTWAENRRRARGGTKAWLLRDEQEPE